MAQKDGSREDIQKTIDDINTSVDNYYKNYGRNDPRGLLDHLNKKKEDILRLYSRYGYTIPSKHKAKK